MASYPSSMTDSEWEILETLLPPKPDTLRGRPQEHSRREIIDSILYIPADGRGMAHDAQRPASLENLLSILPALGQTRALGADPHRAQRHGAAHNR